MNYMEPLWGFFYFSCLPLLQEDPSLPYKCHLHFLWAPDLHHVGAGYQRHWRHFTDHSPEFTHSLRKQLENVHGMAWLCVFCRGDSRFHRTQKIHQQRKKTGVKKNWLTLSSNWKLICSNKWIRLGRTPPRTTLSLYLYTCTDRRQPYMYFCVA